MKIVDFFISANVFLIMSILRIIGSYLIKNEIIRVCGKRVHIVHTKGAPPIAILVFTARTGSNDVYTDLSFRVQKRGSIQGAVGTSLVLPDIFCSGAGSGFECSCCTRITYGAIGTERTERLKRKTICVLRQRQ